MSAVVTPVAPESDAAGKAATRSGGRRLLAGIALSLLSAALMVMAQREYGGLWPLAFVAVVPAIVAAYRLMPRGLSGVPLGIAWLGYWLAWGLLNTQIAPVWSLLLGAAIFGVIGALISSFDRRLAELTGYRFFLLGLPVTWTAFDMLFGQTLIIGGEGQYSSLVAPAPLLLQPLSLVGQSGLTFWLVMVNCAIALGVIALIDRRWAPKDSIPVRVPVPSRSLREVLATGAVVSVAWLVVGAVIFGQVRSTEGPSVRVAAIQPGPGMGYDAAGIGVDTPELRAKLVEMTKQAAAQGAQLAVWGEQVLKFDPRTDPNLFVQETARQTGMYIQTGWSVGELPLASNMTGLWDPQGDLVGIYYKIDPVIIGNEDFVQPVRYPVFETSLGTIAMIICFDFSFEEPTRQMVNGGAQLMGASVGDWSVFAPMRIETVQLRAAENRVPFVKSELINASAIVDATGTIVSSADMGPDGGEALLVADVPLGPRGAPYTSLGPLFGYLCVLLLVGRIALQVRLEVVARRRVLAAGRLHATAGTAT